MLMTVDKIVRERNPLLYHPRWKAHAHAVIASGVMNTMSSQWFYKYVQEYREIMGPAGDEIMFCSACRETLQWRQVCREIAKTPIPRRR